MNLENLRNVEVPETSGHDDTDRLASVRGRIRTAERRRAAALAGGTVAGIVAIVAVVLSSTPGGKHTAPPVLTSTPTPTPSTSPASPSPFVTPSTVVTKGAPDAQLAPDVYSTYWSTWTKAPKREDGYSGIGAYGVWTGKVLVDAAAGCCAGPDSRTFVSYDPTMTRWATLTPFPGAPRSGAKAVFFDGSVWLVGGELVSGDHPFTPEVWALDMTAGQWSQKASLPATGSMLSLTATDAGIIAVVKADSGTVVTTYDPASNTWGHTATTAPKQLVGSAAVWDGSALLLFGGHDGDAATSSALRSYDPATGVLTTLAKAPVEARMDPTGVWDGHEAIFWGGAVNASGKGATGGAAFTPTSGTWRAIATAPLTSGDLDRSVWTGTRMVVLAHSGTSTALAGYDPVTDSWEQLTAPNQATAQFSGLTWTRNLLLVTGGIPAGQQGGGTVNEYLPVQAGGLTPTAAQLQAITATVFSTSFQPFTRAQLQVEDMRISQVDPTYAIASLQPRPGNTTVQAAGASFHLTGGHWTMLTLGAGVLCGHGIPAAVHDELGFGTCNA